MAHSYDSHDVERRTDPRRVGSHRAGSSGADPRDPGQAGADQAVDHPTGASRAPDQRRAPESSEETSWTTGSPSAAAPARTSPMATAGLVLGLLALFCALTGVLAPLAIICGILGIVFGIMGRRQGSQPRTTGRGLATAGLIMGIIALVLGILAGLALTMGALNPDIIGPVQQQFGGMTT